jgi:hypothetical protein
MRFWPFAFAVVLGSAPAAADPRPYNVSADVGPRLGTTATFPRVSATIATQFWDRLEVGLRVGVGAMPSFLAAEQSAEVGLWLYPSRSLRLLVGWRLGHVYLRDGDGGGIVRAHAAIVESFAEIEFKLGKVNLRVAPMVLTGYRAGTWLLAVGPELGVSTWF